MADDIDHEWEREKRERRWMALREDRPIFGLTPSEAIEFARLDAEFSATTQAEEPRP